MIRFFDILFSFFGLLICSPIFLLAALFIKIESRGGVFFLQDRVGRNDKNFRLIKLRTMLSETENRGGLTIGSRDNRITGAGDYLRKFKFDELPQLFNVLKGEMSLVGPRPELRKYVDHYSAEQRKVLSVKPGITDYASLEYIHESDILAKSADPEKEYIELILPAKIKLNMRFINDPSLGNYFRIILLTLKKIV